MLKKLVTTKVAVIGMAVMLLSAKPADAHPHAWIDVSVNLVFDAAGRVTELHQTWLFDDFYSMFVMEGAVAIGGGEPSQEALDDLMRQNMINLAEYSYFTEAKSGEVLLSFGTPFNLATGLSGSRLEMSFALPIVDPPIAAGMPFSYSIYDPTYYIEMLHTKAEDKITLQNGPAGCAAVLEQPEPDPEQVMFAAALGPTEDGPVGLGQIFAETVRVSCQ